MDTVVYKLHSASKYPLILEAVTSVDKEGKGLTKIPIERNGDQIEFQDAWMNIKLGTLFFFNYNIRLKLPSSATGITVTHDKAKDLIKFEFSLPKYLFANNVCEIIPGYASEYYRPDGQSMELLCAKFWHRMMKYIFKRVIHELTSGTGSNFLWQDVQISRVDISFNQIFKTEDDAKFYLESIKRLRIKKSSEKMYHAYDTAATFNNPRYYWKIYHKGAEFKATGRNQIIAAAGELFKDSRIRKAGTPSSDLPASLQLSMECLGLGPNGGPDELQNYADRILRYELECRGGLMSYLFNRHFKKQKLTRGKVQIYKQLWQAVFYLMDEVNGPMMRDVTMKCTDIWGKVSDKPWPGNENKETVYYLPGSYFADTDHTVYGRYQVTDQDTIKKLERIQLTKKFLKVKYGIADYPTIKKVNKFLTREQSKYHQFFFEIDNVNAATATNINNNYDDEGTATDFIDILDSTDSRQKFSVNFLRLLIRKHNQLFREFQFEELPEASEITMRVKDINYRNDATLSTEKKRKYNYQESKVQLIFELLKHATWDEIKKSQNLSRKTLYNWKKMAKDFDPEKKTVNYTKADFIASLVRDTDKMYIRHYSEMLENSNPLYLFVNSNSLLIQA
jgi:hypothetical protein